MDAADNGQNHYNDCEGKAKLKGQTYSSICYHNWILRKLVKEEEDVQYTSNKSDAEGLKFGSLPTQIDG